MPIFNRGGVLYKVGTAIQALITGIPRGSYAIDLQLYRSDDDQVASGDFAVIGGGEQNRASGEGCVVGGGAQNVASGLRATVGGGYANQASGSESTVPGGSGNVADGASSFACGASANDGGFDGCFVFNDIIVTQQATFNVAATNGLNYKTGTIYAGKVATDEFIKIVVNGNLRYIRLYEDAP